MEYLNKLLLLFLTKSLDFHVSRPPILRANCYLTIIPLARVGSESIAHQAEWAIDSEAMRVRGIIV